MAKKRSKNRVDGFIKNPRKALFTLAAPIVVAMLVQTLYNIVDTAFVGRLGAESIAALTFAFPIFFILMALNAGVSAGMTSRISRCLGAKQRSAAENAAFHGMAISLGVGLLIFVAGLVFIRPIFSLFGASNAVLELSISYMSIILFGVFFMFPAFVMSSIFSGQGDTRTPMKVQVTALILNIILDPIFIYVLGWGVKGAAVATVISFATSLALFWYFIRTRSYVRLCFSCFRFSWNIIKDILKVGMPASLTMLLISLYIIFINRLMAMFGTDYVAAFGLVSRMESMAILPLIALSVATLTLVGMFYGAKRYDLLKSTLYFTMKVAVSFSLCMGALFFIFSSVILRIFTSDALLLGLGSSFLRISVLTLPFFAVVMIVSRAMQGMGRGLPGLVLNLVRVALALSIAYAFVLAFSMGYLSVAAATVFGTAISSVIAGVWLYYVLKRYDGV